MVPQLKNIYNCRLGLGLFRLCSLHQCLGGAIYSIGEAAARNFNIKANGPSGIPNDHVRNNAGLARDSNVSQTPTEEGRTMVCETQYCHELGSDFWDAYDPMQEKTNGELRDILEWQDPNDSSSAHQKARLMYASCMDNSRMQSVGLEPWLSFIELIAGPFPFFKKSHLQWKAEEFNWLTVLMRMSQYGIAPFLPFTFTPNDSQPERNIIQFRAANLLLPLGSYLNANESAYNGITETAKHLLLGLGTEWSQKVEEDLNDVLTLDKKFVEYKENSTDDESNKEAEDGDATGVSLTLEQFYNRYLNAFMALEDLLEYIRGRMPVSGSPHLITKDLLVSVDDPDFFLRVHRTLAEYNGNAHLKGVLANYLGWIMAHGTWGFLPKSVRDRLTRADPAEVTTNETADGRIFTWRMCLGTLKAGMRTAVGSLYVVNYYLQRPTAEIPEIVENLKTALATAHYKCLLDGQ
ncbi:hypothetical protein BV898_15355 [Hypsibius exemplaris]|uniref:Peptidase M13 N-terminal domain-containing protein n=1 Tax=Hypsibius exemplaris TaxID=2072580 RepID=A0A9X6NDQ8_HYPEX|nr:hypothetical protein BV898_15355 [Hypsibius exemplaris]